MFNNFKLWCLNLAICVLTFASLSSTVSAEISREAARKAVTAAEFADGATLHDYTLTDQNGKEFHLKEYFGKGKPFLVSFIYTSCALVCPTITDTLLESVKEVKKELGDNFEVLTIGFDAKHDTPKRLREYGGNFKDAFKHMRFAAGDEDTIRKITKEFGFYYEKGDHGFEHMNMVSVVSSDGRIYKQVYTSKIGPEDIRRPLEELISGKIREETPPSLIDRIKQFCAEYDPATGKYYLNYSVLISILLQTAVIITIGYLIAAPRIRSVISTIFRNSAV